MTESFKLFGVAILCAIACVVIKNYKNEFHITAKIAGIVIIFGIIIGLISPLVLYLKGLAGQAFSQEQLDIILKTLAVAYITHISSDICRECGEVNIASGVEMMGKIEILLLSLPIVESILKLAGELMI